MNRKRILRYIRNLIIFFFASTILSVVALRFIPVYITPLMVIRSVEQLVKGEKVAMKHKWVPKEKISRHLPMAVIASEDNRFASHNGFDFKEISKAIEENKKRKKARGASTISQQTAKNVFLWPSSSWVSLPELHRNGRWYIWSRSRGESSLSHHGLSTHSQTMCTYCSQSAESKKIQFRKTQPLHVQASAENHVSNEMCSYIPGKSRKVRRLLGAKAPDLLSKSEV